MLKINRSKQIKFVRGCLAKFAIVPSPRLESGSGAIGRLACFDFAFDHLNQHPE